MEEGRQLSCRGEYVVGGSGIRKIQFYRPKELLSSEMRILMSLPALGSD